MKNFKLLLVGLLVFSSLTSCSFFFESENSSISQNNPSQILENDKEKETVTITTSNSNTHSNLVDVIEDVRPSVVDINA